MVGGWVYRLRFRFAASRILCPFVFRFLGFFFILVSPVSSRGLVLGSDVDSTSRAGVVGVVGGTFSAGVVSLSCPASNFKYIMWYNASFYLL